MKNAKPQLNLRATLECGQVFHWRQCDSDSWEGLVGSHYARVKEASGQLQILQGDSEIVRHYFALDHDLNAIYEALPKDDTMQSALRFCKGLRILRQPAWECLATFITSSMKQVAHIRGMSLALREAFGTKVMGTDLRAYPTPESIAQASEDDLRACGLGFRAPNLRSTAQLVASGKADLGTWSELDDESLCDALCGLPGVGRKVANCVMLFGFERLAAFPVDTWIARVMKEHYWRGRGKATPQILEQKLSKKFGPYAGYAQQYLFHHARMQKREGDQ